MAAAVRLGLAQWRRLRRGDIPRPDAVALNIVLAVLGTDIPREHFQPALCRGIGGDGLAAKLAHHGADVDYLSVAFAYHAGDDVLCHDERRDEVYIYHLAEIGGLHLQHRDAADYTGVVDKDIYRAEVVLNICDELYNVGLICDVGEIALGVYALGGIGVQRGGHVRLTAAVEGYLRTGIGEGLRNGKADAVCRARDEGDLAFKRKLFKHGAPHFCRRCTAKPPISFSR